MKIPLLGSLKVWDKSWQPRKKGFAIGTALGMVMWAISVDFMIALSMIPVVVVLGLVFLPLIVGMVLTTLFFGGLGYVTGLATERMGSYQGIATVGLSLALLVGIFITAYTPAGGILSAPDAATASARMTQYAMQPYETLASVSGRVDPGVIYINYAANYQRPVNPVVCPSTCKYGCFPGKAECKSLDAGVGINRGFVLD